VFRSVCVDSNREDTDVIERSLAHLLFVYSKCVTILAWRESLKIFHTFARCFGCVRSVFAKSFPKSLPIKQMSASKRNSLPSLSQSLNCIFRAEIRSKFIVIPCWESVSLRSASLKSLFSALSFPCLKLFIDQRVVLYTKSRCNMHYSYSPACRQIKARANRRNRYVYIFSSL